MVQKRIPCVLMRGGTSRGPFFLASDLPRDARLRDAILIAALGSGHDLQVDGIGGGNALTSKVAIVGPSSHPQADVDYLFAQVHVAQRVVDTSPNCGNMLAAVGPFAIEQGLVPACNGTTRLRIHNVNTGKVIEAVVQTPGGRVTYEGEARIDGVPGTAAPIQLAFLNAAGSKTGRLLPTGQATDVIQGVTVSCIDAATPLVVVRAADLGKTGHESPAALDSDRSFMATLNAIRIEAGARMGLGDVTSLVVPKPVLIAPGTNGGTLAGRYFMPHACHKAFAVTGAVGLATACGTPGTLAAALVGPEKLPRTITIEHPSGRLDMQMEQPAGASEPVASVLRTARRIFDGTLYVHVPRAADHAVAA